MKRKTPISNNPLKLTPKLTPFASMDRVGPSERSSSTVLFRSAIIVRNHHHPHAGKRTEKKRKEKKRNHTSSTARQSISLPIHPLSLPFFPPNAPLPLLSRRHLPSLSRPLLPPSLSLLLFFWRCGFLLLLLFFLSFLSIFFVTFLDSGSFFASSSVFMTPLSAAASCFFPLSILMGV